MKFDAFSDAYRTARQAVKSGDHNEVITALQQVTKLLATFQWARFNIIDQEFTWIYLEALIQDCDRVKTQAAIQEFKNTLTRVQEQSPLRRLDTQITLLKAATTDDTINPYLHTITTHLGKEALRGHYNPATLELIFSKLAALKAPHRSPVIVEVEKTVQRLSKHTAENPRIISELYLALAHLYYIAHPKKNILQFESSLTLSARAFRTSMTHFQKINPNIQALIQHYLQRSEQLPQPLQAQLYDQLYYHLTWTQKLTPLELTTLAENELFSPKNRLVLREFAFMHPQSTTHSLLIRWIALEFQKNDAISVRGLEAFFITNPDFMPFKRVFQYHSPLFSLLSLPLEPGLQPLSPDENQALIEASSTIPSIHQFLIARLRPSSIAALATEDNAPVVSIAPTVEEELTPVVVTPILTQEEQIFEETVRCLNSIVASSQAFHRAQPFFSREITTPSIEALSLKLKEISHTIPELQKKKQYPDAWFLLNRLLSLFEEKGFSCKSHRLKIAHHMIKQEPIFARIILESYGEDPEALHLLVICQYENQAYQEALLSLNKLRDHAEFEHEITLWKNKIEQAIEKLEAKLATITQTRKDSNPSLEATNKSIKDAEQLLKLSLKDTEFNARVLHEKIALEIIRISQNNRQCQTEYHPQYGQMTKVDMNILDELRTRLNNEVLSILPQKADPYYTLGQSYYLCSKVISMVLVSKSTAAIPGEIKELADVIAWHYQKAIEAFKNTLLHDPNHPKARWYLAFTLTQLSSFDHPNKKEQYYREAASHWAFLLEHGIAPLASLYKLFGINYFHQDQAHEAYRYLQTLIQHIESNPHETIETDFNFCFTRTSLYYFSGMAARKIDDMPSAMHYFSQAKAQFETSSHFDCLGGEFLIIYCEKESDIKKSNPMPDYAAARVFVWNNNYYFRDYNPNTRTLGEPIPLNPRKLRHIFSEYAIPMVTNQYLKFDMSIRLTALQREILATVGNRSHYFQQKRDEFFNTIEINLNFCRSVTQARRAHSFLATKNLTQDSVHAADIGATASIGATENDDVQQTTSPLLP